MKIDDVDVFDSEGTMAIQWDGHDLAYLKKTTEGPLALTDAQHQRLIDAVAEFVIGLDLGED